MNKMTMKTFDEMYLTQVEELTPERIRQIQRRRKGGAHGKSGLVIF